MPVPPYGLSDIPGSDTAFNLIVNLTNGNIQGTITGTMRGLAPKTTYTVYISNGYTPYKLLNPINVVGTYTWLVEGTYSHDLVITAENPDGTFSGTGGYPAGDSPYTDPGATAETIAGQVTGNQITLKTTYSGPYNTGYTATASGTIASDGSMSGTSPWEWHTTSGAATLFTGSTGWPGLLTSSVEPFTFTTSASGNGTWHVNLTAADLAALATGTMASVWINGPNGSTILVSNTFGVK